MVSRQGKRSRQRTVVNALSVELAKHFGVAHQFTAVDIHREVKFEFTPGELRGALNYMRKSGILYKCGTSKKTGHYKWIMTSSGIVHATRAGIKMEKMLV
jgi:hypothetical protein